MTVTLPFASLGLAAAALVGAGAGLFLLGQFLLALRERRTHWFWSRVWLAGWACLLAGGLLWARGGGNALLGLAGAGLAGLAPAVWVYALVPYRTCGAMLRLRERQAARGNGSQGGEATWPPPPAGLPAEDAPLFDIHGLQKGWTYTVAHPFTDSFGQPLGAGQRLTYAGHDFFPYDSGHTLYFAQRTVRLSELDRADVVESLDRYLRV